MRLRIPLVIATVIAGLSFVSGLFAQAKNQPPSVAALREEQRIIAHANLGDAEFQIKTARERLGSNNHRLAQQSGLWALEQLAYAKRRLERHAPQIEQAHGAIFRASEATRRELRESYGKIRERYVQIEERLESLGQTLASAGLPLLSQTVTQVRGRGGDEAIQAVRAALGGDVRGDQGGNDEGGGSASSATPPSTGGSIAGNIPGLPGGTASAAGGQVTVTIPGGGTISLSGNLSRDGRYVDSPEFGRIDLASARTLPDGTVVFQSDRGLVVRGPDGKWRLFSGTQLNPDGSATTASGQNVSLADLLAESAGGSGDLSGVRPREGDTFIDAKTGKRITVGPDWDGNKQAGVSKDYIGGAGATLVSETKVTREIVGGGNGEWKVQETPGESRSWNLTIRMGERKTENGMVTLALIVDSGSSGGFKILSWEVADDKGNRAAVAPSATSPGEAVVTFAKGGEYTFTVRGETDWGSPFRVKGEGGVYP